MKDKVKLLGMLNDLHDKLYNINAMVDAVIVYPPYANNLTALSDELEAADTILSAVIEHDFWA